MKFVIASSSKRKLAEASLLLESLPQVEFRQGSIAELGAACDAGVLHYTIAHDRYGGRPIVGSAQVLHNSRNDGAPPVIIATPPLEAGSGIDPDTGVEAENHAMRMLSVALTEWSRSPVYPERRSDTVCLIHIEGAGFDFGDFAAMARGIKRAIEDFIDEPEP